MAEIIKINDNSWRIEEGFVRYYLLEGKDFALMVDSGASSPDARQIAEGLPYRSYKILGVLVKKLALEYRTGIAAAGGALRRRSTHRFRITVALQALGFRTASRLSRPSHSFR